MCVGIISSLGSLLLLFSFVLELFILIGQAGNTSFLRQLNFLVARNQPQDLTYTTALWNYCQGNYLGMISSCVKGKPAFNWAQTPGISQVLPSKANSSVVNALFLAMFCLFFIGCGFSFILWLLSLPVCFAKRRGLHFSMGTFVFINFLIMLAALIIALVAVISGSKQLHEADNNWYGRAGNSLWITIGAVVALLLATLFYSGSGICAGKKKKVVDTDPNVKAEPYPQDFKVQQTSQNPGYIASNVYVPHNQYQTDARYVQHPTPNVQQDVYYNASKPGYTTPHTTAPYSGPAVDPYTGKPIQDHQQQQQPQYVYQQQQQQQQQHTGDVISPTVKSGAVPSQTVKTTDSIVSGQVPNTAYPNNPTNTITNDTKTYSYDKNIATNDTTGSKVIYVPTDQGPVPVDQNAISSNLQTVDANGNPIVKP